MDPSPDLPQKQPLPPEFTAEQLSLMDELAKVKGGFHLDKMLQGAYRALWQEDNPEYLVQAAQSARELIEKFEHAMHGLTAETLRDRARQSFKDKAKEFQKRWSAAKTGSAARRNGIWSGKIDRPLGEFLSATDEFFDWYKKHDIYREEKERAMVLRLDPMFSALSQKDQRRVTREWVNLRSFFVGVAHHGQTKVSSEKMEEMLAQLVRYLYRRLAPVDAANKEAIKAHIAGWEKRGVTDDAVKSLPRLLDSGADAFFFFAHIQSPDWLPVLRRAGYFDSPPEPSSADGSELHPLWPQSRFLLKMVGPAPAETAATLIAIPATKNVTVNEDIFHAGAALPPEHIGRLVSRLHHWVKANNLRMHSQTLTKLLRNVAECGSVRGALGILEDVIAFKAGEYQAGEKPKKGSRFDWTPEPTVRLESYEYGEILRAVVPHLAKANARKTLEMLCRVTDGYIRARGRRPIRRGYDGSAHWRPSIAEGGQNLSFDAPTELVSALRRAGDDELKAGRLTISDLLAITRPLPWDLFRRLEMHWMSESLAQVTPAQLKAVLVKRSHLHSDDLQLEYGLLLQTAFPKLRRLEQRAILRWIAAGPSFAPLRFKRGSKMAKEAKEWANRWRMKRWYWIKNHLPAPVRAKYRRWAAKGWEPEHPGYQSWSTGMEPVVEQAPITLDALHALSFAEQAQYLRTWQPSGNEWRGPSRAGLANVFEASVAKDLSAYIAGADQFIDTPPEYVAAFFSALWQNLKDGAARPLAAVLALARWMLRQPDDETDIFHEFVRQTRRGRRWYPARLALARLLHGLLRGETTILPASDRAEVWALLEGLAADPDPAPSASAEQGDDEASMGPFNLSLNSIRGQAFHGIFEYAGWCHRTSEGGAKELPPEVRSLLEKYLDPNVEPSRTVRSVYGANINRLTYLDAAWLGQNHRGIFPGAAHPELDAIAWATFIKQSRPYFDVLQLLDEEFRREIQRMLPPKSSHRRSDPRVQLGCYLINLYWAGHLNFDSATDLVAEYFARAPDEVRAEVVQYIGRSLKSTSGPIPSEILERLYRFWDWRLGAARTLPQEHAAEIGAFAWWFDSGKLDHRWSAAQMVEALALSRRHGQQFLWMKQFAEMAESETPLAVRGLELTYEIAREAKATFWNDEEAIRILRAGIKSVDADTVQRAKRLQDALLREGRNQFLDLK